MWELSEYHRDVLIQPCFFWLREIDEETQDAMVGEIIEVFYAWRDAQADERGLVKTPSKNPLQALFESGMLSSVKPSSIPLVPVKTATPLEVAGSEIHDDIDLAFKIWFENFPPFLSLIENRGLFPVFSLIGVYSKRSARIPSLINLNRFLTEQLIALAIGAIGLANEALARKHQAQDQLRNMRGKAAETKRSQARERRNQAREAAIDYFFKNPAAKYVEAADFLSGRGVGTPGSVIKLIGGTKTEALKLLTARGNS